MNPIAEPLSFREACFAVRTQKWELVHLWLAHTEVSSKEAIYLRAWLQCHRLEIPTALALLAAQNVAGDVPYDTLIQDFTIRRLRPVVWWLLGNLAREVGRAHPFCLQESLSHYERALDLLVQRRMGVGWLRAWVLCEQAEVLALNKMSVAARLAYEEALGVEVSQPDCHQRIHVRALMGLCDLCGRQGDAVTAHTYGMQALALLAEEQKEQRAHLLAQLGDAQRGRAAGNSYRQALALTRTPLLRSQIYLRLARLALFAANLERASTLCALAYRPTVLPAPDLAELLVVRGELEAAAQHWDAALDCFQVALQLQATPDVCLPLGEVLASILEHAPALATTPLWQQLYLHLLRRPSTQEPFSAFQPSWPL